MAVVQDIYNDAPAKGYAGMVRNGETSNRISRTVEDVAGLAFGAPAFKGANDHGVTGVTGTPFQGFVIADHGVQPLPGGVGPDTFPRYATAGIMTLGSIGVPCSVPVNDEDALYITPAGLVTNVAAGNIATGWKADETLTAAGLLWAVRR